MISLDEAVGTAATGDVWLFRGRSLADRAIQTVTNSPVNHVGMVVALDDLPPLLWHAELGRSLPDVWSGERQRGAQLHTLREAVTGRDERSGPRHLLGIRRLGDVAQHRQAQQQHLDRPGPHSFDLLHLQGQCRRAFLERDDESPHGERHDLHRL